MPVGIDSHAEKIALMAAGTGTTLSLSGLREYMARAHKIALDFKKAKGQFRLVFFSYFPFQELCKSSSGGTAACITNSAVPTVDQFYLAISHWSKKPHIPLKNPEPLLKNIVLPLFKIRHAKFGMTPGFVQPFDSWLFCIKLLNFFVSYD